MATEENKNISRYEIEKVILEFAKQCLGKGYFTTTDIRGYIERKHSDRFREINGLLIAEVLQSLTHVGVFLLGKPLSYSSAEANLPWVTITEYGKNIIEKNEILPFDPEGYADYLKHKIPQLDSVVLYYLSESIHAFHGQLLVSSTLTLGVASERLIILLSEAYINSVSDPTKKEKLSKQLNEMYIGKWYKILDGELKQLKRIIPDQLFYDFDIYLSQFFNFIRISRNEKGHPEKISISRDAVYATLLIFREYTERIYALISFFLSAKT